MKAEQPHHSSPNLWTYMTWHGSEGRCYRQADYYQTQEEAERSRKAEGLGDCGEPSPVYQIRKPWLP